MLNIERGDSVGVLNLTGQNHRTLREKLGILVC